MLEKREGVAVSMASAVVAMASVELGVVAAVVAAPVAQLARALTARPPHRWH